MSSLAGGWDRRGGGSGSLELPRQQPPVVVDVGCNCRGARLLGSLISSLKSYAHGVGKAKSSPHASSSWSSSTTTTAFTSSVSTTSASSAAELHAWGPATYYSTNASAGLYDE
ncbi:hypothetical protein BAE44_0020453, partial [Dichanthelium oligosanthes]